MASLLRVVINIGEEPKIDLSWSIHHSRVRVEMGKGVKSRGMSCGKEPEVDESHRKL